MKEVAYNIVNKYVDKQFVDVNIDEIYNSDINSLGIDSLSIFKVLIDIENYTNVKIDYINFNPDNLKTIATIANYLDEVKNES